MKPCEHITDNLPVNIKIAENQEEYQTLPANYSDGLVTFAFDLDVQSLDEIGKTGKIYVSMLTGGKPMQPIYVTGEAKDIEEFVGSYTKAVDE